MKNSPNEGYITGGKMDNFWFSDAAPTLERKHEGITSRPRESWAREILGWSGYHRVESRMSGEIFEGRKDEFADSTKSARPNERGPRNHVELLFRCRVECKSVRVYPKYRTAQISRAAPVFFLHPLSLSLPPSSPFHSLIIGQKYIYLTAKF